MTWPTRGADPALARLDVCLVTLVALLAVASGVVWLEPRLPGIADARALDIAINVTAIVVGAAVAMLGWVRWRETGETVALYQSGAFVALTAVNALTIGIVIVGREVEFGLSAARPGSAPVYLWTVTRLAAALLLVIGAVRSLRREQPPLAPLAVAVLPAVAILAVGVMVFSAEAQVPPVPDVAVLDPRPGRPFGLAPASTLVGLVQVAIFAAFIVAAILFRRLYIRDRLVAHAFLAAGLVIAAFSQLHFALDPVVTTGIVTSADALRVAFYAVLFLGIQAQLEADLATQRRANAELVRLGKVDADNAALAERTRLAREIHDGLAQDLWYAKLKQGRLAAEPSLDEGARTTASEVLSAIDAALADARQAVMAMRLESSEPSSLEELLRAVVDEFADRFAIRTEFAVDGSGPDIPPRARVEALRIVHEALTNVRRHADATVVRVRLECDGRRVRIRVADNGRGIELAEPADGHFGLRGMRERAELIGASLRIRSAPQDGTEIVLTIGGPDGEET